MRTRNLDRRSGPVENLLPNPSMERVQSGTATIRRNLYAGNRLLTTTATGAILTQNVTEDGQLGDTYEQSPSNATAIYRARVSPSELARSITYTGSALVKNVGTIDVAVGVDWCDVSVGSSAYLIKPGETVRVSATSFRPGGYDSVYSFLDITINQLGGKLHISEILIEARPAVLPYFNGAKVNDRGVAYSWEGTAGSSPSAAKASFQEWRRNWATNPRCVQGGGGWGASQSSASNTPPTAEWRTDTTTHPLGIRTVRVVTAAVDGAWMRDSHVTIPVTPLTQYALSDYIRPSKSGTTGWIGIVWRDAANGYISESSVQSQAVTANVWTRLTAIATAPANAATGQVYVGFNLATLTGESFAHSGLLIETTNQVLPYFDGDNTPDADATPSWNGTFDNSTSILNLALVNRLGGMNILRAASFQYPGELRVVNLNSNSDSCARIDLLPFVREGFTYTVLAKLKVRQLHSAAIAPIQGTQRRSLFLDISGGGGNTRGWGATNPSPNVVGEYIHRLTFTVPAVAGSPVSGLGARLYNGGAFGDASMYWDEAMLVPGVYTGPYIDGDKRGSVWRGDPHDSGSVGYPAAA